MAAEALTLFGSRRHATAQLPVLCLLLAACAGAYEQTPSVSFPTAAFADISEDPVSEEVATEFQAALSEMAGAADYPSKTGGFICYGPPETQ